MLVAQQQTYAPVISVVHGTLKEQVRHITTAYRCHWAEDQSTPLPAGLVAHQAAVCSISFTFR